jgi:hypothetical protein
VVLPVSSPKITSFSQTLLTIIHYDLHTYSPLINTILILIFETILPNSNLFSTYVFLIEEIMSWTPKVQRGGKVSYLSGYSVLTCGHHALQKQ